MLEDVIRDMNIRKKNISCIELEAKWGPNRIYGFMTPMNFSTRYNRG